MPTSNRRSWVPLAVAGFLAQDYTNTELVILDDGYEDVSDILRSVPRAYRAPQRVRYYKCDSKRLIGEKRNMACRLTEGELIAHWDDDDWYHPKRLSEQVALLAETGADCVGYNNIGFYDTREGQAYRYENHTPYWGAGTSLMYRKSVWQANPFKDGLSRAEDEDFVTRLDTRMRGVCGLNRCVARVHYLSCPASAENIEVAKSGNPWFRPVPLEQLPAEFVKELRREA